MRRGIGVLAVLVLSVLFAPSARAETTPGGAINKVGVQSDLIYFSLSTGMPSNCLYGLIYVDGTMTSDQSIRGRFQALLMASYLSGKAISRVDYTRTSDGLCHAVLVEF